MGEAIKWLAELPRDSITSWEELIAAFYERFFPPSKMLKLRDNIQNFKRVDGEPLHETWLRFQKLLIQCPTHGVPDNVLPQYFYRSLDSMNKGIADHLVRGGLMGHTFAAASVLLDEITRINRAWHTREVHVSPLMWG